MPHVQIVVRSRPRNKTVRRLAPLAARQWPLPFAPFVAPFRPDLGGPRCCCVDALEAAYIGPFEWFDDCPAAGWHETRGRVALSLGAWPARFERPWFETIQRPRPGDVARAHVVQP